MFYLFKAVLLLSILSFGYLLLFHIHIKGFQRVLAVFFGIALSTFIIVPEWSTRVAHWFGIGRGVDFTFYLAHVFSAYLVVRLYLRQQKLQADLTLVVRSLALSIRDSSAGATADPPRDE